MTPLNRSFSVKERVEEIEEGRLVSPTKELEDRQVSRREETLQDVQERDPEGETPSQHPPALAGVKDTEGTFTQGPPMSPGTAAPPKPPRTFTDKRRSADHNAMQENAVGWEEEGGRERIQEGGERSGEEGGERSGKEGEDREQTDEGEEMEGEGAREDGEVREHREGEEGRNAEEKADEGKRKEDEKVCRRGRERQSEEEEEEDDEPVRKGEMNVDNEGSEFKT